MSVWADVFTEISRANNGDLEEALVEYHEARSLADAAADTSYLEELVAAVFEMQGEGVPVRVLEEIPGMSQWRRRNHERLNEVEVLLSSNDTVLRPTVGRLLANIKADIADHMKQLDQAMRGEL